MEIEAVHDDFKTLKESFLEEKPGSNMNSCSPAKVLSQFEPSECDDPMSDPYTLDDNSDNENNEGCLFKNAWYLYKQPEVNKCPFENLHHSGLPTEFMHYPLCRTDDKRSKTLLAGMNDLSTGVCMKVQFIVNNLKDCLGIWPQLFLQKLNTILVYADPAIVREVLSKDDFAVLKDITAYYGKQVKCCMVFRYWCFMYIAFSRNLIQVIPARLKDQLVEQLQIDFALAAQNSCRCKLDLRCLSQSEPDDEHKKIGYVDQMKIIAVLLYYLECKIVKHSTSACEIYKEEPPIRNVKKFIEDSVVPTYIKLYENSRQSASHQKDFSEINLMELLTHLLMGYNIISPKNVSLASAIQQMLDMGYLSSAGIVKNSILGILEREYNAMQKGPGFQLLFSVPEIHIYFTTLGIEGVLTALTSLTSGVEYGILSRDEQISTMDIVVRMQMHLSQTGMWNSGHENIYMKCCQLQSALEERMGYHNVDLECEGINVMSPTPKESSESENESSQTSQSRLHPHQTSEKDSADEWVPDARSISRMRQSYENEINPNVSIKCRCPMWASNFLSCFLCCKFGQQKQKK